LAQRIRCGIVHGVCVVGREKSGWGLVDRHARNPAHVAADPRVPRSRRHIINDALALPTPG
jgi:hypothetical protein